MLVVPFHIFHAWYRVLPRPVINGNVHNFVNTFLSISRATTSTKQRCELYNPPSAEIRIIRLPCWVGVLAIQALEVWRYQKASDYFTAKGRLESKYRFTPDSASRSNGNDVLAKRKERKEYPLFRRASWRE
jgi:hypothetical protein